MRLAILTGVAIFAASPAIAAVNLEYGQEYETAYLTQCTVDQSQRTCQCAMELLQEKVGFWDFAEQVSLHRERFMQESDLREMATDLIARCTAIGAAQ
jgi:hypothetical protein